MTHSCSGAPYDIAFAGAGLAAVSLALRLIELPDPPRNILIDPRTEGPRDRTWCYWHLHDNPFTSAITHRWPQWKVSGLRQSTTIRSANTPYVRLPADQLHQLADEKLSNSPHVTLLRGASVTTIEAHPAHTTSDRHEPVLPVTTPLPIFPDRSTLLPSCQSRPVTAARLGPNLKRYFPPTENLPKLKGRMQGHAAGFCPLLAPVP